MKAIAHFTCFMALALGLVAPVPADTTRGVSYANVTACFQHLNGTPWVSQTTAASWDGTQWRMKSMPGTANGCRTWYVAVNGYVCFAAHLPVSPWLFSSGWSQAINPTSAGNYETGWLIVKQAWIGGY
jgi:hypothetical protein